MLGIPNDIPLSVINIGMTSTVNSDFPEFFDKLKYTDMVISSKRAAMKFRPVSIEIIVVKITDVDFVFILISKSTYLVEEFSRLTTRPKSRYTNSIGMFPVCQYRKCLKPNNPGQNISRSSKI